MPENCSFLLFLSLFPRFWLGNFIKWIQIILSSRIPIIAKFITWKWWKTSDSLFWSEFLWFCRENCFLPFHIQLCLLLLKFPDIHVFTICRSRESIVFYPIVGFKLKEWEDWRYRYCREPASSRLKWFHTRTNRPQGSQREALRDVSIEYHLS